MRMASKSDVSWPLSCGLNLIDAPCHAPSPSTLAVTRTCRLPTLHRSPPEGGLHPHRRGRRRFDRGIFGGWRFASLPRLGAHELDVETERLQLANQHVERLR